MEETIKFGIFTELYPIKIHLCVDDLNLHWRYLCVTCHCGTLISNINQYWGILVPIFICSSISPVLFLCMQDTKKEVNRFILLIVWEYLRLYGRPIQLNLQIPTPLFSTRWGNWGSEFSLPNKLVRTKTMQSIKETECFLHWGSN